MNTQLAIPILLLLPLLGGLGLAALPAGRHALVRVVALLWSLLAFALSLLIAYVYFTDPAASFASNPRWIASFGLSFGYDILDPVSLWLVLLTTFLMPVTILGSFSALHGELESRTKEFFLWLLVLEAAMIGTFVATDLLFFYVCFEFTLVPLYFLIGIFGSSQRLKAARVFFLYTFTGSMLTFAAVLYVAWYHAAANGAWTFNIQALTLTARGMSHAQQTWILLALLAGFAVKVPLFPVHTWLPLAHTEAPTAGSVILAGVLLKLGTYGILRLAIPMCPMAVVHLVPAIAVFAIVGILYTGLICWGQKDIKKLIAYSSVSHLGFCVLGLVALNPIGVSGAVMYMVNHGLSTGAMFLCVGMIYERFHTREMAQLSGLGRVMPVWASFMVFFALASVGLPGLNGFVGEFLTVFGAFTSTDLLGPRYAAVAGVGMVIGAIYILYMVGKVVFGPVKIPGGHHGHGAHDPHHAAEVRDLGLREIVTLLPLAGACLVLGLYPKPMLDTLQKPVAELISPAQQVIAVVVEQRRIDQTLNVDFIDHSTISAPAIRHGTGVVK